MTTLLLRSFKKRSYKRCGYHVTVKGRNGGVGGGGGAMSDKDHIPQVSMVLAAPSKYAL